MNQRRIGLVTVSAKIFRVRRLSFLSKTAFVSSAARCTLDRNTGAKGGRSDRSFGVVDAAVLVVVLAVGFASYRVCKEQWAGMRAIPFSRQPDEWPTELIDAMMTWVPLWLTPATVALLGLRCRQPRPRLRRLARQPGFVASVAASSVFAVGGLLIFLVLAVRLLPTWRFDYWRAFYWPLFFRCAFDLRLPNLMGAAVAGTWLILILSGRWHPAKSWLDRLGRILGCCWIALFLINGFLGPWFYLGTDFSVPSTALRLGIR